EAGSSRLRGRRIRSDEAGQATLWELGLPRRNRRSSGKTDAGLVCLIGREAEAEADAKLEWNGTNHFGSVCAAIRDDDTVSNDVERGHAGRCAGHRRVRTGAGGRAGRGYWADTGGTSTGYGACCIRAERGCSRG